MKTRLSVIGAAALITLSSSVSAHIGYGDLGVLANPGDASSFSKSNFSSFGWAFGAGSGLGDSHQVAGSTGFFKFNLSQAATVRIDFETTSEYMNPAFSVYSGLLPNGSHDYDTHDDNTPKQTQIIGGKLIVMSKASLKDMAPNDPQIRRYILNPGGPVVDANNFLNLIENPIWNVPNANLGGLTPAQWYAANYTPHNGYRDTLNFTAQGGLVFNPAWGWKPGNYDELWGPYDGFIGQFDPFGDWSMANGSGEWSKISYVSSVSDVACQGPNCLSTTTGGFVNPGHFAGNNGLSEVLTLTLAAGDYTIAVDGEFCRIEADDCQISGLEGMVSIQVVPIPAASWLFASGLLALIRFKRLNER